jgi:NADH-quinone oxidoreductase subunit G
MPIIHIDHTAYEVKAGKNLLESCLSLDLDLPYFCWHPALGSVGACRQCAVKLFRDTDDTKGKLVMSCMETVKEGLILSITDPAAKVFREQIIEWLMTNHPHDCPVCDEGGSCHLQDMTVMTGHDYRRFNYKKRTYNNQYLGPLIHHEMNRCIQCYRCVRYYRDYAGGDDLNVFAAHDHVYFGREKDGVLQSPFSGNLAEVCPTGVFTDKTLKEHYTRKWDLTNGPSICQHCSLGCNIIAGERYGQVRSIINRYNGEVNGYFLCDKGRFGYEFVNSENRIKQPLIRNRTVEAVNEEELTAHLKTLITNHTLIGIGSPRASIESNYSLMQLVGKENFYQGINDDSAFLHKRVVDLLQSGQVHSNSIKEIEQADAVLILGEDIWNTAPIMALAVRQAVMKTAFSHAREQTPLPEWHDIAVRELAQEDKGYLANITMVSSALDEISTHTFNSAPDDISRLGFAIAHELDATVPSVSKPDEAMLNKAKAIAAALQNAKRPVIISGVSSNSEAIIKAAHNIAAALNKGDRKAGISYVLPECNSMGLAMMNVGSFEKVMGKLERKSNSTVIILEQDLYRVLPESKADVFFSKCSNVIVLDSLHNRTTQKADVLIPAASFAEADGSLVNNEGRAQHFYQVYMPENKYMIESWKWFGKINGKEVHPDDILEELEKNIPAFEGISSVALSHDFRIRGQAIPREPHRYSGRTAMHANLHVSEPKPLQDGDSPLSYTMEGFKGMPPSSSIPFYWSPGWNSVQSLNKYQQEVGGALRGGDPGIRLFKDKTGSTASYFSDIPEAFIPRHQKWLLLPQYHLFGSGEMSIYSKGIKELSPGPYIGLSPDDAKQSGAEEGTLLTLFSGENEFNFPLKIINELQNGIALVPAGLAIMPVPAFGSWVSIINSELLILNSNKII